MVKCLMADAMATFSSQKGPLFNDVVISVALYSCFVASVIFISDILLLFVFLKCST